jgi:hypothetical protein
MPSKGPQDFDFDDDADEDPQAEAKKDEEPEWTESSKMAIRMTTIPAAGLPPKVPFVFPGATEENPDADGPPKDAAIAGVMDEMLAPKAHSNPRLFDVKGTKPEIRQAFLDAVAQGKTDAEQTIRVATSMLAGGEWPTIDDCIPKGSLLHEIDQTFIDTTDIPRELPMFAAIHYVSALLLQRGVGIEIAGEVWRPDIWTICLAESGSGKSFASSRIGQALGGSVKMFPDSDSAAKFAEDLRDHNKGLWMRDEFAQFLKSLGSGDAMAATKDYLLRCYDGSKITRSTKAETVEIVDPALTIFGSTVFSTVKDYLTREMLEDGFAQRFAFVVAERDPNRPLRALYDFAERAPQIRASWKAIVTGGFKEKYTVDVVARAAFEESFQVLLARGLAQDLELSFIKRITHRGVKYALIYHILLGKKSKRLDAEDFAFAAKLCALSMRDLRKVLDLYGERKKTKGSAKVDDRAARVAEFLGNVRDTDGPPVDARALGSRLRQVRESRADEVRAFMQQAVDADPSLAPYVILPKQKGPAASSAVPSKLP